MKSTIKHYKKNTIITPGHPPPFCIMVIFHSLPFIIKSLKLLKCWTKASKRCLMYYLLSRHLKCLNEESLDLLGCTSSNELDAINTTLRSLVSSLQYIEPDFEVRVCLRVIYLDMSSCLKQRLSSGSPACEVSWAYLRWETERSPLDPVWARHITGCPAWDHPAGTRDCTGSAYLPWRWTTASFESIIGLRRQRNDWLILIDCHIPCSDNGERKLELLTNQVL